MKIPQLYWGIFICFIFVSGSTILFDKVYIFLYIIFRGRDKSFGVMICFVPVFLFCSVHCKDFHGCEM